MSVAALVTTLILASPVAGPSFDCARVAAPDEVRICADPELARLDRQLAALYSWSLGFANGFKPKDEPLRTEQRKWLDRRGACAARVETEQGECIHAAYVERIGELRRSVGVVPNGILVTHRMLHKQRSGCEQQLQSWPEIVGSPLPGVAAFNASVDIGSRAPACTPPDKASPDVHQEADAWFRIAWTTDRYVTVVFEAYGYGGGAHGWYAQQAGTFDLLTGRPVKVADVFSPDSASRKRLAALIRDRITVDLLDEGVERIPTLAFQDGFWTFDSDGAWVTFPLYAIAGYAAGMPAARFSWKELRPFLRPDSPLPPQ